MQIPDIGQDEEPRMDADQARSAPAEQPPDRPGHDAAHGVRAQAAQAEPEVC
jgi:hypothetical protein